MVATAALMMATAVSVAILYVRERRLPLTPLLSAVVIGIFGGLTLALKDDTFIKMKPTIVNLLFASILLVGLSINKPPLKYLMQSALHLSERGWRILSLRWACFFIFLAGLNEYIWRSYPEDFWVNFKVFGMLPLTLLFLLTQIPLIQRYIIDNASEN